MFIRATTFYLSACARSFYFKCANHHQYARVCQVSFCSLMSHCDNRREVLPLEKNKSRLPSLIFPRRTHLVDEDLDIQIQSDRENDTENSLFLLGPNISRWKTVFYNYNNTRIGCAHFRTYLNNYPSLL